ncbi:Phenylacetaldehyde reductase-like protein [Drosera capensis]
MSSIEGVAAVGMNNKKVVCVTGASGYIASWMVKSLLLRGYTVRATVRDLKDPQKTEHLLSLDGAQERLHLFQANLLEDGSFDSAVDGCEGVFHTASPVLVNVKDHQTELLDPAVKGTINVLASCAKFPSVKRVVLTSSIAAVVLCGRIVSPEVVVDETWFSVPEICTELKQWYSLSKTLAEEAAWKFAKENGIDLVSINPAIVIGPLLQPKLNPAFEDFRNLIRGTTFPNSVYPYVHISDVVDAHILVLEVPSANGRYNVAAGVVEYSEVVKILGELYPDLQLPTKCAEGDPVIPTFQFSKEKVKSLGIEYIPLRECLKDTVDSLKDNGFL